MLIKSFWIVTSRNVKLLEASLVSGICINEFCLLGVNFFLVKISSENSKMTGLCQYS